MENTEIKKEGMFPARVRDTRTGLDLNCIFSYSLSISFIVVNDVLYQGFTKEKSLEEQIKPNGIMAASVSSVYPNGVPLEKLQLIATEAEKAVDKNLSRLFMGAGVIFRTCRIKTLIMREEDMKRFTDAAAALGQPALPEAPKQPEPAQQAAWTCYCGNVCFSNFCPQCGSRRPRV